MNEWQQYFLLLRFHRRMARSRIRHLIFESRLTLFTLIALLVGYGLFGYLLFERGILFVERIPGIGGLLGDRILYLLFFFFFFMLIFSVGITNYIGLIKGKEVGWLLTLPVTHRVIFLWKSTEAVLFASWGLLFISAPLLLAFAATRDAPWTFYPKALIVLLPFVIVAATIGCVFFLALLRWVSRRVGMTLAGAAIIGLLFYGITAYRDTILTNQSNIGVGAIDQILKHTEPSVHPLSPSSWLSLVLVQWTRTLQHGVAVHSFALWSWALMSVNIMCFLGATWFYPGWIRNMELGAASASRRREKAAGLTYRWVRGAKRAFGLRRPIRAVIRKDILAFIREPSQWVQFVIVYGLLLIYVLNLRNMGYDLDSPFWSAVVSYLNLTVCALALSTLTTRFVFPQFSLEGTRLWVLGMAPLGLDRVVLQKWVQAFVFTGILTTVLQVISGFMLKLPAEDIVMFSGAVLVLSMGLCGISVGLGALFPNLKETNAAKIVSGFGGTLCLIWSFLYIVAFVTILCLAKLSVFRNHHAAETGAPMVHTESWRDGAVLGMLGVTLVMGGIPLILAMRKVRRLEFLGPMS